MSPAAAGSATDELSAGLGPGTPPGGAGIPAGGATVVGSPLGWPASTAAFVNGSAIAADQLQDGHRLARAHPASHVVPAVLALAEERNSPDTEPLACVGVGCEAGVRIGRAMGGTPDGAHDIGTWGPVAVAAAEARLLAPGDAAPGRRALDLAGSAVLLTDAGTVFQGSTGSHAFLGASVSSAAAWGWRQLPASPRRPARWSATCPGSPPGRGRSATSPPGGRRRLAALRGAERVRRGAPDQRAPARGRRRGRGPGRRGVRGADVRSVEVGTTAAIAAFAAVGDDELAARFSVPTSVAVPLLTGRLDEATLDGPTAASDPVRSLAGRVQVVHHPDLDTGYPAGRPGQVTVSLTDGRELEADCDRPRGDADRALTREELAGKADRLLTARFGPAAAGLLPAAPALGSGGTAGELGAALRAAVQHAQDQEDDP